MLQHVIELVVENSQRNHVNAGNPAFTDMTQAMASHQYCHNFPAFSLTSSYKRHRSEGSVA